MLAHIFPGQGAQKEGMGADLFDRIPEFYSNEDEINNLLGYSVRDYCSDASGEKFNNTKYVQPCLFLVNALHHSELISNGERPDFLAGHSLGEYNALLAAGAFDLMTGLRLVKMRGELMSEVQDGAMAAVVGLDAKTIKSVIQESGFNNIDFANYNTPMQTVLSGLSSEIEKAIDLLTDAGARMCIPLRVSGAFHSRYMVGASQKFSRFINTIRVNPLQTSVISNVTAQLYPNSEASIKSLLVRQISEPVQWSKCIQRLSAEGATEFKEVGDSNILSPMVRQIQSIAA